MATWHSYQYGWCHMVALHLSIELEVSPVLSTPPTKNKLAHKEAKVFCVETSVVIANCLSKVINGVLLTDEILKLIKPTPDT